MNHSYFITIILESNVQPIRSSVMLSSPAENKIATKPLLIRSRDEQAFFAPASQPASQAAGKGHEFRWLGAARGRSHIHIQALPKSSAHFRIRFDRTTSFGTDSSRFPSSAAVEGPFNDELDLLALAVTAGRKRQQEAGRPQFPRGRTLYSDPNFLSVRRRRAMSGSLRGEAIPRVVSSQYHFSATFRPTAFFPVRNRAECRFFSAQTK